MALPWILVAPTSGSAVTGGRAKPSHAGARQQFQITYYPVVSQTSVIVCFMPVRCFRGRFIYREQELFSPPNQSLSAPPLLLSLPLLNKPTFEE